jgi:NAD(P)-dependent dehydrogenase (short-subunit alcohol dehydrogenase family)
VLDRDSNACARLKEDLPSIGEILKADVADVESVAGTFTQLDATAQGLDILVNNAGISIRPSLIDITPEEWQHVMDVNLNGMFYVAHQAAQRMLESGKGVIINMGSTNALMGYPLYADCNASKAGVVSLTRSMALELAPKIWVVAVCPGYVLTPMQASEYTPAMLEEVNRKIPLGRHAQPEKIAALIAFLTSDEACYLTGHPYIIDGGEIAGGLASR